MPRDLLAEWLGRGNFRGNIQSVRCLQIVQAIPRIWTLLWGPLVTLSVIATGNHYLLDAAAGLFVTALAYAATRLSDRLLRLRKPSEERVPRRLVRLPRPAAEPWRSSWPVLTDASLNRRRPPAG
jgi:membrane-associated phospholipid phosphatase